MIADDAREAVIMLMARLAGVALTLVLILAGCKTEVVDPDKRPVLRLSRGGDGTVRVELSGADRAPRAVQLELRAEGAEAVVLEDASSPAGLPLDTVRLRMRGTSEAVLFVGDKRGVRLNRSGEIARFRARSTSGTTPDAKLGIAKALVVDADANEIDVQLGAALPLR